MDAFHLKSIKKKYSFILEVSKSSHDLPLRFGLQARYGVTTLCEVKYVKFWQTYDGKSEHCKIISESQNLAAFLRWT